MLYNISYNSFTIQLIFLLVPAEMLTSSNIFYIQYNRW